MAEITFEQIKTTVRWRQNQDSPLIKALVDMRNRYNGDAIFLPFPDLPDQPAIPNVSPHLIAEAIDTTAMRAASVLPLLDCYAIDGSKQAGKNSRANAVIRKQAVGYSLGESGFVMGRRRYYRHLAGYATCSLAVLPSSKGCPHVEIRDPLVTYPEPQAPELLTAPNNVAYISQKSAGSIRSEYPKSRVELGGPIAPEPEGMGEMWELVEWIDADIISIGLLGPVWMDGDTRSYDRDSGRDPWLELKRWPNKAGRPIAFVPRRVTMDKVASQVANVVGQADIMNRLIALDIIAQEKAIFPDRYIIARPGEVARVQGGGWKDGREGGTNIVEGAETIGELRNTPDMRTGQVVDRIERNIRVSTGNVPQGGGETYGALRTGRGIDALMGAAVDMRIQELHEISEGFLPDMCEAILATYVGYWPGRKYTVISRWRGAKGRAEFTPNKELAESYEMMVAYPITGADITQTTVGLAQARAAKGISQRTYQKLHPWIDDGEQEARWINEEDLEEAMKTGIMQKILEGALPPIAGAWLEEFVREGDDIYEAVKKLEVRMRELQAQEPPPAPPGQQMDPSMAPGLGAGGPAGPMPPGPQVPPMGGGPAGMSAQIAPGTVGPSPGQADIRRLLLAAKANAGIS
jgi:hypothetical protein